MLIGNRSLLSDRSSDGWVLAGLRPPGLDVFATDWMDDGAWIPPAVGDR